MQKNLLAVVTCVMLCETTWGASALDIKMEPQLNNKLRWSQSLTGKAPASPPMLTTQGLFTQSNQQALVLQASALGLPLPEKQKLATVETRRRWSIMLSDKTLYRTMRRWAQEADYQLMWQVDRDYPIEASVEFENTLREAVEQVMAGVALTDYPIQAVFNPSARVLRVIRHMDDGRK